MARLTVYEELEPTDSYTRDITVTIPPTTKSGQYTLTLSTDYTNAIFEHTNENNNQKTVMIEVVNLPPDLKPSNMMYSIEQSNVEAKLGIAYEVENGGEGSTSGLTWYDSIYLSEVPEILAASVLLKRIKRGRGSFTRTEV